MAGGASYGVHVAGITDGSANAGQAAFDRASQALHGAALNADIVSGDRTVTLTVKSGAFNLPSFFGGKAIHVQAGAVAREENLYLGAPSGNQ